MHMRKFVSVFLTFVLLFSVVYSVCNTGVEAAGNDKKKVLSAYKQLLRESDYTGFRLVDLNKDGTKELLTTYDGYGKNVYRIYVYTYRKKKVVSCNNDMPEYSMSGFRYSSATGKLYGFANGNGSDEQWYYTLKNKTELKKISLQKIESRYNYQKKKMYYNYYYNNKKITKKQYNKKLKSWNRNVTNLKFYRLSDENIDKYVK